MLLHIVGWLTLNPCCQQVSVDLVCDCGNSFERRIKRIGKKKEKPRMQQNVIGANYDINSHKMIK